MFSLFRGVWDYLFTKSQVHILIVGLDYAGKTTLLEQLKGMFGKKAGIPLELIPPTVGLNLAKVDIKHCKVIFWDLGGQERLRSIWKNYYHESQGLIYLLDAADPKRFEQASRVLDDLMQHPDLKSIPVLVLANKQDLEGAGNATDVENALNMEQFSDRPHIVKAISAKTLDGVREAMHWLIDQV